MAPNNLTLEAAGGAAGALVHSADQMAGSDTLGVERAKPCRIVLLTALLIIKEVETLCGDAIANADERLATWLRWVSRAAIF
jgi:hypothetical protein